jgi:hypothetical protein
MLWTPPTLWHRSAIEWFASKPERSKKVRPGNHAALKFKAALPRPMKPSALRIERMLEKIEAKLVPPERKWLRIIIHEGDAEAVVKEKQKKALAEHVARARFYS